MAGNYTRFQSSARLLAGAAAIALAPLAHAADKPAVGPAPDWVAPAPPLDLTVLPRGNNAALRFDEQELVSGDRMTVYLDTATVVSTPEALQRAGTISMNWNPSHGGLTFHTIEILRGKERIDVLGKGEGLTVLRREANLERATVDGELTAVQRVEGLRVGDVLHFSFSISQSDPALKGRAQAALVLLPGPIQIGFGRARLVWDTAQPLAWKAMMPGIVATPHEIAGGRTELVVDLPVAKLPEIPKNAPSRFQPLPVIMASSFKSWDEVATVMAPLYRFADPISAKSDLAAAVDAIAARHADPQHRMAEALRLVQDQVRYQLIALGDGNLVPQAPMDTWTRRLGDCKAKTALLLAVLGRLGITAEPVLANSKRGDLVPQMPAGVQAFDHVFVRAEVAGESYWLDGTQRGSRFEDLHDTPRLGYVLPLFAKAAQPILPPARAHARWDQDIALTYDASAGPHLPVPYTMTVRFAGPYGDARRIAPGPESEEQLRTFAAKLAKDWSGSGLITKPVEQYDEAQAVWTVKVEGIANFDWDFEGGRYQFQLSPPLRTALDSDRGKSTWRTIPALIDDPWSAHIVRSVILPDGGKGAGLIGADPVSLALPAVEWRKTVAVADNTVSEEIASRESGAEIAPGEISAAGRAIREAMERTARITLPAGYPQRWADVPARARSAAIARTRALYDARIAEKPEEADRYAERAWFEQRLLDWKAAEADYGKAIALDPTADRHLARASLYQVIGRNDMALRDAQAAHDLEDGNADAREQLAGLLAQAGRTDEALDLLPASPDPATKEGQQALLGRAEVLELGGRHDDAIKLLDDGIASRGSEPSLRNSRCWFNGLRNLALPAALADCQRAIELGGNPNQVLDSRALVEFRMGKLDAAKTDYDAALALYPEQTASLFFRGLVQARLGNQAAAEADLAAARALYPGIDAQYRIYGITAPGAAK